jgi:putative ABC transport system substrate-binding protein
MNIQMTPKRLQLLHEAVPSAKVMALLVNPANSTVAETQLGEAFSVAPILGVDLHVLHASTERDLDAVFANLIQSRAGGLVIAAEPLFSSLNKQFAELTVRHAVPAITGGRDFAAAGGLLSYGADTRQAYRLAGIYTGQVLKGEKPANLPIQQSTKVELVINLKTAKVLGLDIPNTLIGRADEVIE